MVSQVKIRKNVLEKLKDKLCDLMELSPAELESFDFDIYDQDDWRAGLALLLYYVESME